MATAPRIHINGSDPKKLIESYAAICVTLSRTRDLLRVAAPHMRDFYVLPDGGLKEFDKARAENMVMIAMITTVLDEVESLWKAVNQQVETP